MRYKRAVKRYCVSHQGFWVEFIDPAMTQGRNTVDKICKVCRSVFPLYRSQKQLDLDLPTKH